MINASYGSERWALRKQVEQRSRTTKTKMLRLSQGKIRKADLNETIRGIAKVTPIKLAPTQKRLPQYGHVMQREETHMTRSALSMNVAGTRPRGSLLNRRLLDQLKIDIQIYGINPEMATDRERWSVTAKKVDTT